MRKLLIAVAGVTLIAASCGDDDNSSSSSAATTVAGGAASTPSASAPSASTASSGTTAGSESQETTPGSAPVSLEGQVNNKGTEEATDEVDLEMDDYYFEPTFIKASPGATIHVKLENESDDAHTFTIDALGIDQEVAAGKDATVDVKLPQTGAVQFYCRFHGSMGMQGAFFFKEGDQVVTGTTGG